MCPHFPPLLFLSLLIDCTEKIVLTSVLEMLITLSFCSLDSLLSPFLLLFFFLTSSQLMLIQTLQSQSPSCIIITLPCILHDHHSLSELSPASSSLSLCNHYSLLQNHRALCITPTPGLIIASSVPTLIFEQMFLHNCHCPPMSRRHARNPIL